MSIPGSKRSSVSTVRSKSTRRSSSNLALIQEQSTSPTGSPIKNNRINSTTQSPQKDILSLNLNHNEVHVEEKVKDEDEKDKEFEKKEDESRLVQYARLILPHVGMVIICVMYIITGATIFYFIERPQEHFIRNRNIDNLRRTRENILFELWDMSLEKSINKAEFRKAALEKTDAFIKLLFMSLDEGQYMSPAAFKELLSKSTIMEANMKKSINQGNSRNKDASIDPESMKRNEPYIKDMWSYLGSLFFATATLTTVGYGQIAPVTTTGRLLCVFYGLLGIPLMLMMIADVGKFLGEGLKRVYRLWNRCQRTTWTCILNCFKPKKQSYDLSAQDEDIRNANYPDEEKDEKVEAENKTNAEEKAAEELAADVSTSLPVGWIFLIIIGYTSIGAALFHVTEPWSILESFYFCFITMVTVGYGDYVPSNDNYFALSLLYIVLGLAITTMSIDQAASEYIKKVHYFGRKIQSATQALSNVRNMISYANWIKRRYGLTDQQIRQMTMLPEFFGMHDLMNRGAYMPNCYKRLYYVDQGTESMLEEIFTITTESDQEQDHVPTTLNSEFRPRIETLTLGSTISSQYREIGGMWSKMKRRLKRRGTGRQQDTVIPNIGASMIPLREYPISDQEQRQWPEMGGPNRRAFRSLTTTPTSTRTKSIFSRTHSGTGFLETVKPSTNNNHSPKLIGNTKSSRRDINRQLTSLALIKADGNLINL